MTAGRKADYSDRGVPRCQHCNAELKRHEQPEGFCDDCLRKHTTKGAI